MIVYRLTPYTDEERLAIYGPRHWNDPIVLPEYPSKRDLVEFMAQQARLHGLTYADQLRGSRPFDARFRNIYPPE